MKIGIMEMKHKFIHHKSYKFINLIQVLQHKAIQHISAASRHLVVQIQQKKHHIKRCEIYLTLFRMGGNGGKKAPPTSFPL